MDKSVILEDVSKTLAYTFIMVCLVILVWKGMEFNRDQRAIARERACIERWQPSNLESVWFPGKGCYVRTSDGFIPEEYYRSK